MIKQRNDTRVLLAMKRLKLQNKVLKLKHYQTTDKEKVKGVNFTAQCMHWSYIS